jgi:hypothetical protein
MTDQMELIKFAALWMLLLAAWGALCHGVGFMQGWRGRKAARWMTDLASQVKPKGDDNEGH